MTASPYDNLPVGDSQETQLQYVDVDLEDIQDPKPAKQNPTGQPKLETTQPEKPRPEKPQPPAFVKTTPLDKPPQYAKRSIRNMQGAREYILPFEESLLVPDTMPDMEKILFTEARAIPAQPDKSTYQSNDFLSGDVTVYTVYKPASGEDCPVDVVKSIIPFKTDKCWGQASGDLFKANISVKHVSAEMINERKFTAKGQLLISFTETAQKDLMVFKSADDKELVFSESSIQVTDLSFEANETTEISQDINIREDQPSPAKILKESIDIIETHRQITSGKLVINAAIHSQVMYLGEEDGEKKLACLANKTDFTQFVPVTDDVSADLVSLSFCTNDLHIAIENQDKFLLQGHVTTQIQGYANRKINMVSDAYHKSRELRFDVTSQSLSAITGAVSGEISAREVISLGEADKKPVDLLCGSCHIGSISGHPDHDRIIIDGSLPVKILALDESGDPFVIESVMDLRGSLELPAAGEEPAINLSAAVKEFWFNEINSRQLEINVSVALQIQACCEETFTTLENLCFAETDEPVKRISMAIYVVGKGDTLWDVAKRYKSDTATLAALNQIDPEKPLPEGMKLFITK